MNIREAFRDFYDLTRLPLGIMGAIMGLTAGMIVVLVQRKEPGQNSILAVIQLLPEYWDLATLGLAIPFLIVGASMALNDFHDVEADRINQRMDRPLVRNPSLNPQYVLFLALSMIALGIIISFFLFVDNLLVTIGVAIFSFLSISYNLWTKEMGIIGNMTVAASDTAPAILALIALRGTDPSTILLVLSMSGITFFGVVGRELVKGVMDIEGDRIARSNTFAVRFGPIRAVQLATIFFVILAAIAPVPLFVKFHNNLLYVILMGITLGLFFYSIIILYQNPSVENGKKARSYTRLALWTGALSFLAGALFLP
ncbi:MAG: UbiA family prenyltransferase [Candidatus Heimdallarchaeota archaeon]